MSNDELTRVYSLLSAYDYLLKPLYCLLFANDPHARENVPKSLSDQAKFRPLFHLGNSEVEAEALVQLQARVVLNLQGFFTEVENVLQQAERARNK
jgi:hypothetical protein